MKSDSVEISADGERERERAIAFAVALIEEIGDPALFPAVMAAAQRIHSHAIALAKAEFDRGAM